MTRLSLAAAVLVAATLVSAGAVSAGPIKIYPNVIKLLNGKAAPAESTSPGDAFIPQTAAVDPRRECLADGGSPERRFDGSDFVWVCVQ